MTPPDAERRRAARILSILRREYPDPDQGTLVFESPYQLLVATMLSAQCTDARVNLVTPMLFKKYPGPRELARARVADIERAIRSINFYRTKARALSETAQALVDRHRGQVPRTREELVALRGVGRKTANCVLSYAYGEPSIVVDTHVARLAVRLGFSEGREPDRIEGDLERLIPRAEWSETAHLLISHGRAICTARRAFCERCPVAALCPRVGVAADPERPAPRGGRGGTRLAARVKHGQA